MSKNLTMEALEQHQTISSPTKSQKMPQMKADSLESNGPAIVGPSFRRMSRMEPRPSVQYRRASMASRRTSVSTSQGTKQLVIPIKLQNTYRMAPSPQEKFNATTVQKIMEGILKSYFDGEVYEPKMCSNLAQNLSDVIKSRVKELGFNRYKIICNVLIGENTNQGMCVASRSLWNAETDDFAEARYNKGKLHVLATVYATYFE